MRPSALEVLHALNPLHLGFLQGSAEFLLKFINHYDFTMQRRLLSHEHKTESKQNLLLHKASETWQWQEGTLPAVLGGNIEQDVSMFSKHWAEGACGSQDTQLMYSSAVLYGIH